MDTDTKQNTDAVSAASKLFEFSYNKASDEEKIQIQIDTYMFLTKCIVSTFEVCSPSFSPAGGNEINSSALTRSYGRLVACVIEFMRDVKNINYKDSLAIINEEAMTFAEIIRKDNENCDCEKYKNNDGGKNV